MTTLEAHRYRTGVAEIEVEEISADTLEEKLLRQFNIAVSYDFALNTYLRSLNQDEQTHPQDFVRAVNLVIGVVRHAVAASYFGLLDYGSPMLVKHARGVLERQQRFIRGEEEANILTEMVKTRRIIALTSLVGQIKTA